LDPISIAAAFASAVGALSTAEWQASTSQTLQEIKQQLNLMEGQMLELIDLLKNLYQYILNTDEDTIRKFITGNIQSQTDSFEDRVSNTANPLHPSAKEKEAFENYGLEVAQTGYSIFVWGGISYGAVAQSIATAFACFKIAQSNGTLVEEVKTHVLQWLDNTATTEFDNARSNSDSIYMANKATVDNYPKRTWLGQEEAPIAGDPNNVTYSYTDWYCNLTGYTFDTGFPAPSPAIVSGDEPPTGYNPRGWPLAPGFNESFPFPGDVYSEVNKLIVSPLNSSVDAGKVAKKNRDDAINNLAAIAAIRKVIQDYHQ
jgi:hypothetical protein